MTKSNSENKYKKFVLFVAGIFILVLGITLVLLWWTDVMILCKGAVGMMLALAGLFMVYAVSKNW